MFPPVPTRHRGSYLRVPHWSGETRALLTDFDRTLTVLFDDRAMEGVRRDLMGLYSAHGIPLDRLRDRPPYTLWADTYRWTRLHLADVAQEINQAVARRLAEHEFRAAERSRLFDGVRSVLEWLHDRGIPVAIVSTNSQRAIEAALSSNGVGHLIAELIGRDDVRVDMDSLKPNPAMIYQALDRIEARPALFVGDSVTDMMAGRAAGLPAVGVMTGECSAAELEAAGAQMVISSFSKLPRLLSV
jgi:phosphoglycolate phosphatase